MANPHKGEVGFKAGDKEYVLSFSADAFAEIEDALGLDVNGVIELFRQAETRLSPKQLRILFWKGLGDHQPELTFDDARAILRKIKPAEMATLVASAFMRSLPESDGEAENPPKPDQQNGTGPASVTAGVS